MSRLFLGCVLFVAAVVQTAAFAGSPSALRLSTSAAAVSTRRGALPAGPQMLLREKVYNAWKKLKDFANEDDDDFSGDKVQVKVTFTPCAKSVTVPAGTCLREAALQAGAPVIYGCRDGQCGTCESELTHEDGSTEFVRICRATVPEMQDTLIVDIQEEACEKKRKSYLGRKFDELQY